MKNNFDKNQVSSVAGAAFVARPSAIMKNTKVKVKTEKYTLNISKRIKFENDSF
jgi:hypothetical protein